MNEFDLLRKKTGMTIAKAWMLMMLGIVVFFLSAGAVGFIAGLQKKAFKDDAEGFIFVALLAIIVLCCIWGFFINKKELPFFKNTSMVITLICFCIILALFYISPILYDLLPYEKESTPKDRYLSSLLEVFLSLALTVLQVGFIGHGLLKNYLFKQVLFTVVAMSIVFIIPQAVIGMAIQTLIMFYVYYQTASFQLPILMTFILSLSELFLKHILKIQTSNNNYIKTQLIHNDTLYYIGIVVCMGIIAGGLYYIKSNTKTIEWQKPEENETLAFL